jgi:hypothetical protein
MSKLITTSNGTIPLIDAKTETEFLSYFAFNLSLFPHARYRGWIDHQSPLLRRVAMEKPPTKIYRLDTDGRLCAIAGYKVDGGFIRCAIVVFGEGAPQFVDPTWLKDATLELSKAEPLEPKAED